MSRLRINKMGVFSVAKMQAVLGLVIGLIIGIIYGVIIILYSLLGASLVGGNNGLAVGGGGVVIGIIAMIGFPIMYGIIGFIGGAIGAFVYNIFAGIIGGIEMEVENV